MDKYYRDMDTVRENIKITQSVENPAPKQIINPLLPLKELVEFIEDNDVKDEICDDSEGYIATWRSVEFDNLIKRAKETLKNLERL